MEHPYICIIYNRKLDIGKSIGEIVMKDNDENIEEIFNEMLKYSVDEAFKYCDEGYDETKILSIFSIKDMHTLFR